MIKQLLGINPYVIGAVAIGLLVLVGWGGCEHLQKKEARADRDKLQIALDSATAANDSNMTTITAQGEALNAWARIGVTPDQVIAMLKASAANASSLEQRLAENAKLKEKDRALPECAALLRMDFGRLCPSRARVLRQYEGDHANRDGQGAGAGVRGAASGTARDP